MLAAEHSLSSSPRFEPTFHALRGALDWQRCLSREPIDRETWNAARAVKCRKTLRLEGTDERIVFEPAPLNERSRDRLTFLADGYRLALRRTDTLSAAQPYAATLDVQGSALSASRTGLDVVFLAAKLVDSWLYPSLRTLHHWLAGRTDFAADIAVRGPWRSEWIEHAFYGSGSLSDCVASFASRSIERRRSLQTRMEGGHTTGRTVYLGRDPLWRIYEKDKHTEQTSTWSVVEPTLRQLGYNPDRDRVMRVEVMLKRGWISRQEANGVALSTFTLPDFHARMPAVLWNLFARTRHTDGDETRVHRRPSSPLWRSCFDAIRQFELRAGEENFAFAAFRHRRREATLSKIEETATRRIAEIAGFYEMEVDDVVRVLSSSAKYRMLEDEGVQRRIASLRARYAKGISADE